MTSKDIRRASSADLCNIYVEPTFNPNFLDPTIKEELERRGHASCTDPAFVQLLLQRNAANTDLGLRMIDAGRPRALSQPPSVPTTTRCRTLIGGRIECTTF
jgi:hypothetical protein